MDSRKRLLKRRGAVEIALRGALHFAILGLHTTQPSPNCAFFLCSNTIRKLMQMIQKKNRKFKKLSTGPSTATLSSVAARRWTKLWQRHRFLLPATLLTLKQDLCECIAFSQRLLYFGLDKGFDRPVNLDAYLNQRFTSEGVRRYGGDVWG